MVGAGEEMMYITMTLSKQFSEDKESGHQEG